MKGSSGTVLSSKIRPPEKTFFSSLVVIIIGPMKLRTFVGPKGPFTDGQRWKLVLVQSLLLLLFLFYYTSWTVKVTFIVFIEAAIQRATSHSATESLIY